MSRLNNDRSDFKCVIFGRGVEADEIQLQIEKLNLSDKILMMGNVKNASSYYHFFNLLIHPAFHAGFSNSISEAVQSDLNVVVGKIGDSEYLFENKSLVFKSLDSTGIYNGITAFNNLDLEERISIINNSKTNLYTLLDNKVTIKKWIDLIE